MTSHHDQIPELKSYLERLSSELRGYVCYRLGPQAASSAADDVIQELCVRVLRNWEAGIRDLDDRGRRGWVFSALEHCVADHWRKQNRRTKIKIRVHPLSESNRLQDPAAAALFRQLEARDELCNIMRRVSKRQRKILFFMKKGYTLMKVSELLKLHYSTAYREWLKIVDALRGER